MDRAHIADSSPVQTQKYVSVTTQDDQNKTIAVRLQLKVTTLIIEFIKSSTRLCRNFIEPDSDQINLIHWFNFVQMQ